MIAIMHMNFLNNVYYFAGLISATDGGHTGLVEDEGTYRRVESFVEMIGRLHADLFLQDKYILNGVNIKKTFIGNSHLWGMLIR